MVEKKLAKEIVLEKITPYLYLFVMGGLFGFVYEEIFYYFDLGELVKRGITFGPWIPIYGFGAIIMTYLNRFCKDPAKFLKVFLMSTISCGVLEFASGAVFWYVFHTRLWDYNVEILNFGNIGGFICLRSVLFFGVSGLALAYIVMPFVMFLKKKMTTKVFRLTGIISCGLFALDILVSLIVRALK